MRSNFKPKDYYSDGDAQVPGRSAPDYETWNADYWKKLFDAFGGADVNFDERRIPLSRAVPYSVPLNDARVNLYRQMLRAGEKLPPLVVQKNPDGSYQILDGAHRHAAAEAEGARTLHAVLVTPADPTGKAGKKHWLRSGDGFTLPSSKSPDRAAWDAKYMERLRGFFGMDAQYRPFNAALSELEGTHSVMAGHPRTDFYARLYRQGERVPPVLVARTSPNRYTVLDGNRRIGSAEQAGVTYIPAVERITPGQTYDASPPEGDSNIDPDPFGTMKKSERRGVPQGYGEWVKHPKLPERIQKVFDAVRDPEVLVERTEDGTKLRKPRYMGHPNRFAGHCYAATEALYHLINGKETGWKVRRGYHDGDTHWWLYHPKHDIVLDPTAEQFKKPVPYGKLKTRTGGPTDGGFLTKEPSKRARIIMERAMKKLGPGFKLQKTEGGFLSPPPTAKLKGSAFRHRQTGQVVFTGAWHDPDEFARQSGQPYDENLWEDGFVDHGGRFYNRDEAARFVGADYGLESQDYAQGAHEGVYKEEYVGELHRDDKGRFMVKEENSIKKRLGIE